MSVEVTRDRIAIDKAKQGLLFAVRRTKNQPGQCIDLPRYDDPRFNNVVSIAVMELLKEHSDLTVSRWRGKPAISYKRNMGGIGTELEKTLAEDQFFVAPGDFEGGDDPITPLNPEQVPDPMSETEGT